MTLWWLSFADPCLPTGTQFLGALILPASGVVEAARVAHALGLNPGGEVVGFPMPDAPHTSWVGVLLDRATIDAAEANDGAGWALEKP